MKKAKKAVDDRITKLSTQAKDILKRLIEVGLKNFLSRPPFCKSDSIFSPALFLSKLDYNFKLCPYFVKAKHFQVRAQEQKIMAEITPALEVELQGLIWFFDFLTTCWNFAYSLFLPQIASEEV